MKIKKVEVVNFRNLKNFVFEPAKDTTAICGQNDLGKSNLLNALVWFFTNTIYTDKLGVGENDINSICPKNQLKGEHVSVSVEFYDYDNNVNGPIFTKVYKTGYDRQTGKANKHSTDYLINGASCSKESEWNEKLYQVVNYVPILKNVKEINLFIDPLYALLKLDNKLLRVLLTDLGCDVSNEELYNLGFEDLKQYEAKYFGNFVEMRKDFKSKIKSADVDAKKYETLVSQYGALDDEDLTTVEKELSEKEKQIELLTETIAKLKVSNQNENIKNFENELLNIKTKLENERSVQINNIQIEINNLMNEKAKLENELYVDKNNEKLEYLNNGKVLKAELDSYTLSKNAYDKALEQMRCNLKKYQDEIKVHKENKTYNQERLIKVSNQRYSGYVTCPHCGESFAPDTNDEIEFNEHLAKEKEMISESIFKSNTEIEKNTKLCQKVVLDSTSVKKEISKLEQMILETNEKIIKNNSILAEIDNEPVDPIERVRIEKVDARINELKQDIIDVPAIENNSAIVNLNSKIEQLKLNNQSIIDAQINELNSQIAPLKDEVENLHILRSKISSKKEYMKLLEKAISYRNDLEFTLERVNEFIHKKIECINQKASEKTGIHFVMLEENLNGETVSEVCYATVDGVPFANINTAKKYALGIQFIEKVKEILVNDKNVPKNDLPILADKLEGIDSVEKINTLTNEQLICTRVTNDSEITITKENK